MFVIQFSLFAVSICVSAVALLRRSVSRPSGRFDVNPVSSHWLADHKTRYRPE